jgi:transcriptional regulator with XRE-family HTH domain
VDPRLATLLLYIAANVRQIRSKRGLTQEALAGAVGVDLRFIQKVESRKASVSLGTLVALAEALAVKPGALLKEAELPEAKRGRPRKALKAD